MQIQFPRRIRLGFRPWYGLSLRQLGYIGVAGIAAGAIVFFGPAQGDGLLVRVLIGLGIISVGVALAFFRKEGLTAEQWIATQINFWTRPQKRVWTRSDSETAATRAQVAEMALNAPAGDAIESNRGQADQVRSEPAVAFRPITLLRPAVQTTAPAPVVVLIDMAMALSLFALVLYLLRGGLGEIQGWFLSQVGH